MTIGQLDANLRRFYAEARKKDGETYVACVAGEILISRPARLFAVKRTRVRPIRHPLPPAKQAKTYGIKTLLGFLHGIERYLNQPKLSRNLKMSTDPRFIRSNEILDTRSVLQESPSGRMPESLTAISWRFLAIEISRAWLPIATTHCTAAKSFPAVFKGPRHYFWFKNQPTPPLSLLQS